MQDRNSSNDAGPILGGSEVNEESSVRYTGWRVVAACFVMAVFCWGFGFYGHGVYLAALQQRHGWSASMVSGASTAYYLFSAVLVIFIGDAVTRFGPRRVVLSGIVCLGVSTALIGQLDTLWQLYADYVLMSFGWAAMSVAAISTIVGVWFNQRRGLALNLALTGASVGGIAVTPILLMLVARVGLSPALFYAVVVMVIVLVPMTLAWIRSPASVNTPIENAAAPKNTADLTWTRRRALLDFDFWTISGASALVLFAQVGFLVHQIAFLQPRIGQAEAGLAVAITATLAVGGRLGLGVVIDRFDPRRVSAISYLSQAAAFVAMIWTANTAVLLIACAVFGFSVGNVLVFPALIIQREFAALAFPMLVSFSIAITQFAYALGPVVLGLLRSTTGSYHTALMLCAAVETCAAGIILIHGTRPTAHARSSPDSTTLGDTLDTTR